MLCDEASVKGKEGRMQETLRLRTPELQAAQAKPLFSNVPTHFRSEPASFPQSCVTRGLDAFGQHQSLADEPVYFNIVNTFFKIDLVFVPGTKEK